MEDNQTKIWLAIIGMFGSVAGAVVSTIGTYLMLKARQEIKSVKTDLAGNTETTKKTEEIVNGQRKQMVEEIAELKKQLGAVQVVLSQERGKHPAVERAADHIEKAVEAVKEGIP